MKPPYPGGGYGVDNKTGGVGSGEVAPPAWQGRSIAGPNLRLVEFSAFLEQQRDPEAVSLLSGLALELKRTAFYHY